MSINVPLSRSFHNQETRSHHETVGSDLGGPVQYVCRDRGSKPVNATQASGPSVWALQILQGKKMGGGMGEDFLLKNGTVKVRSNGRHWHPLVTLVQDRIVP